MKKTVSVLILIFLMLLSENSAYAYTDRYGKDMEESIVTSPGAWAPGNPKNKTHKSEELDLKALYEEFQRYWHIKDKDDLEDRFEEFLKSKNIYTKEIDNYDEFIKVWVENYDDELDFDHLYDLFKLDLLLEDSNDPDDYEILLDVDINDLYDDYLDEEYYEDYDEVYYG